MNINKITIINNKNGHCYLIAEHIDAKGRNKELLFTNIKLDTINNEFDSLLKIANEKINQKQRQI